MHLDALKNDIFSFREQTAAVDKIPHTPRQATSLGLFRDKSVESDLISIDLRGGIIRVLPQLERGAPGTPIQKDRPKAIPFQIKAHKQTASVHADAILRARAFGEEAVRKTFITARDENLQTFAANHDATKEWRFVNALRGRLLDADGTTVLLDLFAELGVEQEDEVDFDLATAANGELMETCNGLVRKVYTKFGGGTPGRVHAFTSAGFWDKFVKNPEVRDSFKRWQDGAFLRTGTVFAAFNWGGIDWEEYRGNVGGLAFIPEDKAIFFPTDVGPNVYIQHWAPGTSFEAIESPGREIYVRAAADKWDEEIEQRSDSFGLPICTYPEALMIGAA